MLVSHLTKNLLMIPEIFGKIFCGLMIQIWWSRATLVLQDLKKKLEICSLKRKTQKTKENVWLSFHVLKLGLTMQQDNDPTHICKSTSAWLKFLKKRKKKRKGLEAVYPKSGFNPLNPGEMFHHILKQVIHDQQPSNIADVKQFCKDEQTKIPPQ